MAGTMAATMGGWTMGEQARHCLGYLDGKADAALWLAGQMALNKALGDGSYLTGYRKGWDEVMATGTKGRR